MMALEKHLIEENKRLTEENRRLAEENKALRAQNAQLLQQIEWLTHQLEVLQKAVFGKKSEKTRCTGDSVDQMTLGVDNVDEVAVAENSEGVISQANRPKQKNVKTSNPLNDAVKNAKKYIIEDIAFTEEERKCKVCGGVMDCIGTKYDYELLANIVVQVKRYDTHSYVCKHCSENSCRTVVYETLAPNKVIPGSCVAPETVAYLATQKYEMGAPLYRMEKMFSRHSFPVSRQDMSNWLMKSTISWLEPVYNLLHKNLVKRDLLFADETTLRVLHDKDGNKNSGKDYVWLYRTGDDNLPSIVLYDYCPDRSANNVHEFLRGYKGYLHTDGYVAYHKLHPDITVVGCWAHARRKFYEASSKDPKIAKQAIANKGLEYCDLLFQYEREFKGLPPEQRYKKRLEKSKPLIDAMKVWMDSLNPVIIHEPTKRALHYCREQWPYLLGFLSDGRLELSNNRAERSIKPFVIDRKNFLFCNTPGGAECSAILMSIIETARANHLDPCKYLTWIFKVAPQISTQEKNWAEKLLPDDAPDWCKMTNDK